MTRLIRHLSVIGFLFIIEGCATLKQPFGPEQSFDTRADIKELEEEFGNASSISKFYASAQTVADRNKFITGRLALINLQYALFIRQFAADKAQLDTAMDLLQLGVDLSISVVGGETTKALLGAASSGITGSRASINKNFFFEKTIPTLIAAMNAQRKIALIPILEGVREDIETYPFSVALSDLEEYYSAGTFIGGLQAIQKDAGAKEKEADKKLNDIRTVDYMSDKWGDSIERFWFTINTANETALNAWIKANPVAGISSIDTLINSQSTGASAARQKVQHDLNINISPGVATNPSDVQNRTAINVFWKIENITAKDQIQKWLNEHGLDKIPIETFISGDVFAPARKGMVTDLKIPITQ